MQSIGSYKEFGFGTFVPNFWIYIQLFFKYLLLLLILAAAFYYKDSLKNAFFDLRIKATEAFMIKNVRITGDTRLGKNQIKQLINIDERGALYDFNASVARAKLMLFPWIKDVEIKKLYPSQLVLTIKERKAAILYVYKNKIEAIDNEGILMGPSKMRALPIVEGQLTAKEAFQFVQQLHKLPMIFTRVKSFICFANNRWDLLLYNNIRIKLPSSGAIQLLRDLWDKKILQKLLKANISVIDLRNPQLLSVVPVKVPNVI